MKRCKLFRTLLAAFVSVLYAGCCISCSKSTSTSELSEFQSEDGYVYSQNEPFGMTYDEAWELYADSLEEIADDPLEGWRTSAPTELIPPENAEFLGQEWMRQLSFDDDTLYLGTYTTRIEPEKFAGEFSMMLDAFYAEFGEGSLSQDEYTALVEEAIAAEADGTPTRVSGYWTGGDHNYLHLYALIGLKSYEEVVIAVNGGIDRVTPFSGSQDLTAFRDVMNGMKQSKAEAETTPSD